MSIDALTAATTFQIGEVLGKIEVTDSLGNSPYISHASAHIDKCELFLQLKRGEKIRENFVTFHQGKWWLCNPESSDFIKKSAMSIYGTLNYATFDEIWENYLLPTFEKQFNY
jgi:hypothetical protein